MLTDSILRSTGLLISKNEGAPILENTSGRLLHGQSLMESPWLLVFLPIVCPLTREPLIYY